jgi:hypothetical protein
LSAIVKIKNLLTSNILAIDILQLRKRKQLNLNRKEMVKATAKQRQSNGKATAKQRQRQRQRQSNGKATAKQRQR